MDTFAPFLGTGTADVLIGAARRLRIPFEPQEILERVEAHPEPHSLLALVEVGRASGFALEAYEAGWDDLAGVALPAIVHLADGDRGETAFAVLVEVDAEGAVFEHPTTRVHTVLPRDAFSALWSGVLVTIAKPAGGTRPPSAAPASRGIVAGDAPHAWARVAGLSLFAGFTLFGGWRSGGVPGVVAALGALVGVVVGMALLAGSRKSQVAAAGSRIASILCRRGTLTDCEGVLSSRWSRLGPFELSTWGFSYFASCAAMLALGAPLPWLAATAVAAAPLSLFLIGVQIGPLRRICTMCMIVHAIVLAGAVAGALAFRPTDAVETALPWALVHALCFLLSLGLLAPFVEMEIENRTHRARLAWIGASAWGALAEYAGRPPADLGLAPSKGFVGGADARFRLDVLVHVTCGGCPPLLLKLERLAARHPGSVRVDVHFPPRDRGVPEDRELCIAFAALGSLVGGEQLLRVFDLVKADAWKRLEAARGGAEAVLREFLPPSVPVAPAIEEARAAVDAAGGALDLLKRGTPTLVLAGRPWDGPLEDLETLIVRHPDALQEATA